MEAVRIGVVGLGNMGTGHIRESFPGISRLQLTAVCDDDAARLAKYPDVAAFVSFEEMIASGLIDAVLIATPHYSHVDLGVTALEAGLHVLVEKPIAVHKEDAEKLLAAHVGREHLKFAAMFNQRTDGLYRKVRELVRGGDLGEIRRTNWIITNWFRSAAYYGSGGWRATWGGEGGGVLLNQCPHNLDLYQWIFGPPTAIRAFCQFGKFHEIEVEDAVTAYFEHANGATGVFVTSTGEFPGTNRLEIAGDRGKLVVEDGKITFIRTTQGVQEFSDTTASSFPSMDTWRCEIPYTGGGHQHKKIVENFVAAILDGDDLLAPASEGIHSVEMANAMIYSSLRGETVHLPLDGAAYTGLLDQLVSGELDAKTA